MNKVKRMRALSELANARFLQEQSLILALRQKETDLRRQLAGLEVCVVDAESPAARIGAAFQYQQWTEQRRKAINVELARILFEIESTLGEVSRTFGQKTALERLVERETQSFHRKKTRQTS